MKLVPANWSDANAVVTDATDADVRQIILKLVTVRCIISAASTIGVSPKIRHNKWRSTFFAFSIIIEGATEKVLPLIMQLKSIYDKNLCFDKQKFIFEQYRMVQTIKKSIN